VHSFHTDDTLDITLVS